VNLLRVAKRRHEDGPMFADFLIGPAARGNGAAPAPAAPRVAQLTYMMATEHATTMQPARWDE
jgi:hypothetical protein